ncbi:hypothetical protein PMG11_09464 [Penicillium brasilianum]|uniref:Uncharacterized protein n=1 Tax=Penicillium brasilianum TaxID=104259 RepID=A0A0F7TZN0_PENBI|nr:hypothetical protein PMG11_09464 [Penicillium brasilianum]
MLKAQSRTPPLSGYAMSDVPSGAEFGSLSLSSRTVVAITSVVTETVHPTWIITEVTTVGSLQLETSLSSWEQQSEESSVPTVKPGTVQTIASQTSQTQTAQLAMTTISQLTVLSPETTATGSWSTADLASSALPGGQPWVSLLPMVEISLTDQTSSSELVPVLSSSTMSVLSSTASPPATASSVLSATLTSLSATSTPTSPGTLVTSRVAETSLTPVSNQSSSSSLLLSPSSSSVAGIASGSDSTNGQLSQSTSGSHLGAIVGGTVGGAVFVALALLVCTLFLRRRRRGTSTTLRGSPGRGPLRKSSDSITTFRDLYGWHDQQDNRPSFPMDPGFSPRGNTAPVAPAPAPNQGVSVNTMDLARDSEQNPFSDPEHSPVSPIINIHPPSRTASNYSQQSGDDGLAFLEKYDLHPSTPSSRYESIYYPDEGTFTPSIPEHDKLAPQENRKTRLSTRSDPFDLEVPPKALQEWPLLPHPTLWGDKF